MDRNIAIFAAQWLRVALMALVPVVLTAFLTIPWNLGGTPGDPALAQGQADCHMT